MNERLWNQILLMPSSNNLIENITGDVLAGQSVIVLLPIGVPGSPIIEELVRRLQAKNRQIQTVEGPFLSTSNFAARVLGGVKAESAELSSILADPSFPEIVLLECGTNKNSYVGDAITLVTEWARYAKQVTPGFGRICSLLLVINANNFTISLPSIDTCLSIRWWWGLPSELEVRLLNRLNLRDTSGVDDLWRECVVAAFGCGDAAITIDMLEKPLLSFRDCIEYLRSYGSRSGIKPYIGKQNSSRPYVSRSPPDHPDQRQINQWAEGQLICSFEHGIEIHPSALTNTREGEDELSRRLWRSQASLLLPMVDRIRGIVCRQLVRDYGNVWWDNLNCMPNDERDQKRLEADPIDAELGLLVTLCRRSSPPLTLAHWDRSLEISYDIRNTLAHYQPVTYAAMRGLLYSL
jgi:hypothetical protein